MALILNIDTSTEIASVSIAENGVELLKSLNAKQQDHASWIHEAVSKLLAESGSALANLDACAVTAGPGSYTGIRVGMATAKGICYALDIPLITANTLQVMALSLAQQLSTNSNPDLPVTTDARTVLCPMIDARRDEVFTAIYDLVNSAILSPRALILTPESFLQELNQGPVIFFGNGSDKWKLVCMNSNASFLKWDYAYFNLAYFAYKSYEAGSFSDLAYVQPDYLKEFHTYKKN